MIVGKKRERKKKKLILSARGKKRSIMQVPDTDDDLKLHILLPLLGIFGTKGMVRVFIGGFVYRQYWWGR